MLTPSVSVGSVTTCAPTPCPRRAAAAARRAGRARPGRCRRELPQRLEQVAARERVDAGVDLADRLLLGRRVAGRLGLHHALDAALRVAHDAPVAARVLELHRRHRGRRAALLVGARERGDRVGGDQRHVAVEHEHGGVGVDQVRPPSGRRRRCRWAPPGSPPRRPRAARSASARFGPSTTTIRPAPASRAAAIGHSIIGRPHSGCSTFGTAERIRVPSPAARISTVGAGTRGIVVSASPWGVV